MLRLPPDGFVETKPEPGEIADDRRIVFGPAAGDVDILDAQDQPPAKTLGEIRIEEGGIGVAPDAKARSGSGRSGKGVASRARTFDRSGVCK